MSNSITVLGIFVADLCFTGKEIPSIGQTQIGNDFQIGPGGKGSNQAITVAKLSGDVNFISRLGDDEYGRMALEIYKSNNVKTDSIIKDKNEKTGVAGIFIDQNGNNSINVITGAANNISKKDIDNNLDRIKNSKVFLTQLEISTAITMYALKKAKDFNCITILNPAPASIIDNQYFKLIDFFTPNEKEAEFYLNKKIENEEDIKKAAKDLLNLGIKNVIITLGEKGAFFKNNDEEYFVKPYTLIDEVVDTTGAGDVFNGALAIALSSNKSIKEAIIFANKVAAISTTKLGAANSIPTIDQVNSN
ncbi:ribokinase [Candidatus Pelagibacter sp.]|nr:ribokinase [Candidatus Pelagibacter sp.]